MQTLTRVFIALIGLIYIALGLWCAIAPDSTSESVGFALRAGQGQSEFVTVYGGLELGLGLVFLWPVFRKESLATVASVCVVIHAGLVVFRSLSFAMFSGFESTTYILAAIEWGILLGTGGLLISLRQAGNAS